MDYYESAEGQRVTVRRAQIELQNHGIDINHPDYWDTMNELRDITDGNGMIDAQELLSLLGY